MKKYVLITFFGLATLGAFAQRMPEFAIKDIDNNVKSFEELKGDKITLFDFWATWCKPCQKAIPELNKNIWRLSG